MDINYSLGGCLDKLAPKKVLDLGIGNGLRSRRFIKKGSKITGVDKIKMELSPEINFVLSDIKDFEFKESYDLILASLVLHFFKKSEAMKIIKKMKKYTEIGGYNFILNMTPKDYFANKKPENFYIKEEELKKIYSDWEIVYSNSFETPLEEHDNLPPHKHFLTIILAKK